MSFEAMTWAVKKQLPTNQKMVLLMLANRTNSDTGRCDPSHQRLSEDCGMSVSTVKRAISQLEEAGYLVVESRSVRGVSLPNQYLLNLDGVGSERTDPSSHRPEGVGSHRPTKQELLNQEVKPIPHTPEDKESIQGFEAFWKLYPKKKGRKDALKAWNKLKPDPEMQAVMIVALGKHRASRDWLKDGGQYVPLAATWLNGERWEDELATSGAPPPGRPGSLLTNLPQHTAEDYENNPDGKF